MGFTFRARDGGIISLSRELCSNHDPERWEFAALIGEKGAVVVVFMEDGVAALVFAVVGYVFVDDVVVGVVVVEVATMIMTALISLPASSRSRLRMK